VLNSLYQDVQNFLNPEPAQAESAASADVYQADDFGDVEDFVYAAPANDADSEHSQNLFVLAQLYSLCSDKEPTNIDVLLQQVHASATDHATDEATAQLKDVTQSALESILRRLSEAKLVLGSNEAMQLTDDGAQTVQDSYDCSQA
jgi:hypothetical protein